MYGPHYVWILFESFTGKWWVPSANEDLDCNEVNIACAAQNHFSFEGTKNTNSTFQPQSVNLCIKGTKQTRNQNEIAIIVFTLVYIM